MEHQEDWLVVFQVLLVFDVLLVLAKQFWMELDVSRLVYAVNITKTSSDREIRADCSQLFVDAVDILRLGI